MGTLYLVGTPIGNLEDMTFRAVRVLREVGVVAAEDTRHTGRLLKHFEIETPLTSYHDFSRPEDVAALVERLATQDVALVCDAGMPGISDPGYRLVNAAVERGHPVVPIPGPTALITALVGSGLPTDRFMFLGFLPRQEKARRAALRDVATASMTLVVYESPYRLDALLADAQAEFGDRVVCVGRELTKRYEELWRGTISAARAYFATEPVRGEVTVVFAGASAEAVSWDEDAVLRAVQAALDDGLSRKEAAAAVATASGWRRRAVYQLSLRL